MELKNMWQKIFVILILAFLLAGCGGIEEPATDFTVEATDFAYTPLPIIIHAGKSVRLTLKNNGQVEHDFVIDNIAVRDVNAQESASAGRGHHIDLPEYDLHFCTPAGETSVLQFTALEPGTYEIFCSVERHREAGMIGKMIGAAQD
jgi:uncharacterized cupredoxin-like copper-binding protein